MKTILTYLAISIFALLYLFVSYAEALEVGDDAPEISIEKWINGGPVKIKEGNGKKIFVVEFWATWCPPCRRSIPHLSKLQTKFKDSGVEIIGVTNESVEVVEKFAVNAGFTYHVGIDKYNHTTTLYRNGEQGIPHAFVIGKDGKIAWYGHPMEEMETVIEQIIEDKFDRKKAAEISILKKKMQEALSSNDKDGLIKISNKILELRPDDPRAFGILSQLYMIEEEPESYKKLLRTLVDSKSQNIESLYIVAEASLTNDDLRFRDIGIALKAAKSLYQLDKNAEILELLGRIHFELGHIDKAIKYLKRALPEADDEYYKEKIDEMLIYYTSVLKLSQSESIE